MKGSSASGSALSGESHTDQSTVARDCEYNATNKTKSGSLKEAKAKSVKPIPKNWFKKKPVQNKAERLELGTDVLKYGDGKTNKCMRASLKSAGVGEFVENTNTETEQVQLGTNETTLSASLSGKGRHVQTSQPSSAIAGAQSSPEGVFLMSVALIQAKNLSVAVSSTNTSISNTKGYFVKIMADGQEHTSTKVTKDHTPIWNQRFDFAFQERPEEFVIMLYGTERQQKRKLLGSTCYRINHGHWDTGVTRHKWLSLKGSQCRAELQVQVVCRSSTLSPQSRNMMMYAQAVGLCTIRLVRAKDIKPTGAQWMKWATLGINKGKTVQPRVVIEYGLTAYRTKSHKGRSPAFNKECRFWVKDGEENYIIRLSVYNMVGRKSALVGRGYISMSDICDRGGEYDFVVDLREEYDVMRDRDHTAMLKQSFDDLTSLHNSTRKYSIGSSTPRMKTARSHDDIDTLHSEDELNVKDSASFDTLNFNSVDDLMNVGETEKPGAKKGTSMEMMEMDTDFLNSSMEHLEDEGSADEYLTISDSDEATDYSCDWGSASTEGLSEDKDKARHKHKGLRIRKSKPLTVATLPLGRESISGTQDQMTFTTPDPSFTDDFMDKAVDLRSHGKRGALVGSLAVRVKFCAKDEVEHWFYRRMLDEFDEDNDGKLSSAESKSVLEAITNICDLTPDQLDVLSTKLCGSDKGPIEEDDLLQYLQSPEFHTHPMSYSLLSYLSTRPTDLVTLIEDVYETAGTSDKTSTVGASVLTIRDCEKLAKDTMGLKILDRCTGLVVDEHIPKYIKIALKTLYHTRNGKNASKNKQVQRFLKNMSIKEGKRMNDPVSVAQIRPFIKVHKLDQSDWLLPVDDENKNYLCFNDFFYRKLAPGARPIDSEGDDTVAVCPADCRMVVYESVVQAAQIWVKGSLFTVERLLSDDLSDIAPLFFGGSMCIARLAPQDYHRWHVPVSGRLGRKVTVDGQLYTVNPIAIRQKVNVFTENLRVCQEIHTKEFGTVVAVCIGATLVGSVNITAEPLSEVRKGDEHGFFAFGGSTVIILFQPNRIKFDRDMMENSKKPLETLVKMGTRLGVATQPADE